MRRLGSVAVLVALALIVAPRPGGAQAPPRIGVRIPMRDGVNLVADIYLPDTLGRFPAVLIRTPYGRPPQFKRYSLANYVKQGYAVVLQDTRGQGDSEGEFNFYFPEARDGYDSIEWIARQPWSSGRVAMDGGSYLGTVQWLAARERPPSLACIAPTASSGRLFDELPYLGGAFRVSWALSWLNSTTSRSGEEGERVGPGRMDSVLRHRPLVTMDSVLGRRLPLYREFLEHPTLDGYWKRIQFDAKDFAEVQVPALTVTGWFDGDQLGALSYWDGMQQHGSRKENQFLIIGPWTHAQTYLGGQLKVGDFELTQESILDIQAIRLAFYDYCLKGASPRFDAPKVRVFVTAANRWIAADRYPLPDVERRSLYFRGGGSANTVAGDGRLSWEAPTAERPDTFTYDPRNPITSRSNAADRRLEARSDMLVYTSDVLAEPVEIVGRVFVNLFAASDAPDTDFTARLLDVRPDGKAVNLGPSAVGVRRARYRKGYDRIKLLTPNRPEEFSIELFDIGHRFLIGHRIRVEISSSASPYVAPNSNTGLPIATDTTWRLARQTIFHESTRPSRVVLPVLPIRAAAGSGAQP